MAQHTLGRKIGERRETVNIFGEPYSVKAEIVDIDGFSAHADSDALMRYFHAVGENVKQVAVVHGEEKSAEALAALIHKDKEVEVIIPALGESVYINGTI